MRPERVFDPMLQQERTSLAWERTAFSGMAVGLLMTRVGAMVDVWLGAFGVVQVAVSAGVLIWAGKHYEDLHVTLRAGDSPTHPGAARVIGIGAMVATGVATLLALALAITDT